MDEANRKLPLYFVRFAKSLKHRRLVEAVQHRTTLAEAFVGMIELAGSAEV